MLHSSPVRTARTRRCVAGLLIAILLGILGCPPAVAAKTKPTKNAPNPLTAAPRLFAGYAQFNAQSPASVVLASAQSAAELRSQDADEHGRRALLQLKNRLEEASGLPCVVAHVTQITAGELERPNVRAIVLVASRPGKDAKHAWAAADLIRRTRKPLLVVADGLAALCRALDNTNESVHPASAGVVERPKDGKRDRFFEVRVEKQDPLFAGIAHETLMPRRQPLGNIPLPDDLVLLAVSQDGEPSVVKHKSRPVYGVQFRPGLYDYVRVDGRRLLANFMRIAAVDVDRTAAAYVKSLRAKTAAGLCGLHERPDQLRAATQPVVCGIDMEDPVVIQQRQKGRPGQRHADILARFRDRMKELSGAPCMIVHYTQIVQSDFDNPAIRAILIMGQAGETYEALSWEIIAVIRATDKPILGICRGHQLIGEAYGSTVDPMRRLRPGEPDPEPEYHPGFFKERGFLPVRVAVSDPLFTGCGAPPVFKESHYCEVKQLPREFLLLASNLECPIESMKHRSRPVYGVQFHPERYDPEHADGKTLLVNFFRTADLAQPQTHSEK